MSVDFILIVVQLCLNFDGVFQQHGANIYPDSLILNRENTEDTSAHILDLNISIDKGRFIVEVYDKRDDLPFNIVQYAPKCSNMSRDVLTGEFGSQLVRIVRIGNQFEGFRRRVELIHSKEASFSAVL